MQSCIRRVLLIVVLFVVAIPLAEKVSVLPWMGFHRMVEASMSGEAATNTSSKVDAVTSGRLNIWQLSTQALQRQLWFGYGPNGYFFLPERQEDFIHPHNVIIQVFIEWGVVGGGLLLFILASLMLNIFKHIPSCVQKQDIAYLIPAFIVLLLFFNALTDGVFFVAEPLFCIATAIGFLSAYRGTTFAQQSNT